MLFNSLEFVFIFLPLFLVAFYAAQRVHRHAFMVVITAASLVFYSWWYLPNIFVLLFSIGFNYLISPALVHPRFHIAVRRIVLLGAIGVNVALIFYFKYVDYFIDVANSVFETEIPAQNVVLPLAISFFTFQQISYLIDLYNRKFEKPDLLHYSAYVAFFPQLIAGPIVRYNELVPQFEQRARGGAPFQKRHFVNLSVGLTIFAIGLAKKVVIADELASFADPMYQAVADGYSLTLFEAWIAIFAFGFQIYFDFSGYSDMAIGLARMVGFRLPINFSSPYKAASISELWRRWHMTLTRFFTDYVHAPLAVALTRHALNRPYEPALTFFVATGLPLLLTFTLIGMWHGPGLKWLLFGAINGVLLILHRLWLLGAKSTGAVGSRPSSTWRGIGQVLTLLCFFLSLVLFRVDELSSAGSLYASAFAFGGVVLPNAMPDKMAFVVEILEGLGVEFGSVPYWGGTRHWVWLILAATLSLFCPNSQEIMCAYTPAIGLGRFGERAPRTPAAQSRAASVREMQMSRGAISIVFVCWLVIFFQARPQFLHLVPTVVTFLAAGFAFLFLVLQPNADPRIRWRPNAGSMLFTASLLLSALTVVLVGREDVFIYFNF